MKFGRRVIRNAVSPTGRAQQIRFALNTLAENNAHHDFEKICHGLTRRRIASNMIPATGPVGSGGDSGRDGESHWTDLPNEASGTSAFAAMATTDKIVIACTVQRSNVVSKIKRDLSAICGKGDRVDRVIYFTVVSLPIAKVHALQGAARREHDVALDIWDAVGISDHLSQPDLDYLAVEYLHLPPAAHRLWRYAVPVAAVTSLVAVSIALVIPELVGKDGGVPPALLKPVATLTTKVPSAGSRVEAVTFGERSVYHAAINGTALQLSATSLPDGRPLWQRTVNLPWQRSSAYVTAIVRDNQLIVAAGGFATDGHSSGMVAAYATANGGENWRNPGFHLRSRPRARYVSVVAAGSFPRRLGERLLDLATGAVDPSSKGHVVPLDDSGRDPADGYSYLTVSDDGRTAAIYEVGLTKPSHSAAFRDPVPVDGIMNAMVVRHTLVLGRSTGAGYVVEGYALPDLTRRWRYRESMSRDNAMGVGAVLRCGDYVCINGLADLGEGLAVLEPQSGRRVYADGSQMDTGVDHFRSEPDVLRPDRLLLPLGREGLETLLIEPGSGTIVGVRRGEHLEPLDRQRILSISAAPPPSSPPPEGREPAPAIVARNVAVIDAQSGITWPIGTVRTTSDRQPCSFTPEYLACRSSPAEIQIWRLPSDVSHNPAMSAVEPIESASVPDSRDGSTQERRVIGPKLPVREDIAAAKPAEAVWPHAIRRLPTRLPNGKDYIVVGEPRPGQYVVQDSAGFQRPGSVYVFEPATGRIRTLLDAAGAVHQGVDFPFESVEMSGPEQVSLVVNVSRRRALWTVSLHGGSVLEKIPLREQDWVGPVRVWHRGHLIWSRNETEILSGRSVIPGVEGYELDGDTGWAVLTERHKTRTIVRRVNLVTGERRTMTVHSTDWTPLSCADDWCVGKIENDYDGGRPEVGSANTQGLIYKVPWASLGDDGESGEMRLGRFKTVAFHGGFPGPPIIWDTRTGTIGAFPEQYQFDQSGVGRSFLVLRNDKEKAMINLAAI